MTASIVGWAHSRFGKLEGETLEGLITKVAAEALGRGQRQCDRRAYMPCLGVPVPQV